MLSGSSRASEGVGVPLRRGPGARCKMMKNWGMIGGIAAALAAGIYVLWGPITDRKKCKKGLVPGLLNLGNTCFMNSLLQSLSACPSFIHWLEEFTSQYQLERKDTAEKYLSVTLLQLLKALSNQEAEDDEVLDASPLLDVLRTYRWQISSFEEQDAHELFHVLTSSLEDERDHQPHVTHLFDVNALELPQSTDRRQIHCRTQGALNPIPRQWKSQHPFHGRLTSNMICKHCQNQSPMRYDTFDSLSLSIPSASWGRAMTLDNCLQHFISTESVKDVVCENCTKIQAQEKPNEQLMEDQKTTFVKQLKLGKLLMGLIIPRYSYLMEHVLHPYFHLLTQIPSHPVQSALVLLISSVLWQSSFIMEICTQAILLLIDVTLQQLKHQSIQVTSGCGFLTIPCAEQTYKKSSPPMLTCCFMSVFGLNHTTKEVRLEQKNKCDRL